jgi:hypothetical protein
MDHLSHIKTNRTYGSGSRQHAHLLGHPDTATTSLWSMLCAFEAEAVRLDVVRSMEASTKLQSTLALNDPTPTINNSSKTQPCTPKPCDVCAMHNASDVSRAGTQVRLFVTFAEPAESHQVDHCCCPELILGQALLTDQPQWAPWPSHSAHL